MRVASGNSSGLLNDSDNPNNPDRLHDQDDNPRLLSISNPSGLSDNPTPASNTPVSVSFSSSDPTGHSHDDDEHQSRQDLTHVNNDPTDDMKNDRDKDSGEKDKENDEDLTLIITPQLLSDQSDQKQHTYAMHTRRNTNQFNELYELNDVIARAVRLGVGEHTAEMKLAVKSRLILIKKCLIICTLSKDINQLNEAIAQGQSTPPLK